MSKAKVLAAARLRWGKNVQIKEWKHALKLSDREATIERIREINQHLRDSEFDAARPIEESWRKLILAARFVVDVNGDQPSIPGLHGTLIAAEALLIKVEERRDLVAEQKRLRSLHAWRGRYSVDVIYGIGSEQKATADTLGELLAAIDAMEAV